MKINEIFIVRDPFENNILLRQKNRIDNVQTIEIPINDVDSVCAEIKRLKELKTVENKISCQEAKDLLSAIDSYLLCDFGVQDVEMQAQAAAEKERILKIQEKLKSFVGE